MCKYHSHQTTRICGLIPAAGLSRRMGEFKPLLPLGDRTVIENSVDTLLCAGVRQVVVVLGYRGDDIRALLERRYLCGELIFAENPEFSTSDMLYSIQTGLRKMPVCDAFFLLPADMPAVSADTCIRITDAMPDGDRRHIVFPTVGGYRKHPPLVGAGLIPEILDYEGPGGLRGFWSGKEDCVITVPVKDTGCCTDLDTPLQYQNCVAFYDNANTK